MNNSDLYSVHAVRRSIAERLAGKSVSELTLEIIDYFNKRKLQWPGANEAIDWHDTEIGEAQEIWLARKGGWVRNHPDDKPAWDPQSFAEELGDAIMMLIVAGVVCGEDPLMQIKLKMERKLKELT